MQISCSQIVQWNKCPAYWEETHRRGIQPPARDSLAFGTRVHQLLANFFIDKHNQDLDAGRWPGERLAHIPLEFCPEDLANEAQAMFEAWLPWAGDWGNYRVLGVERNFRVPLPWGRCPDCGRQGYHQIRRGVVSCWNCGRPIPNVHTLTGVWDLILQNLTNNQIEIIDHKTERRGGWDNDPAAWEMRLQGVLYHWASWILIQAIDPLHGPLFPRRTLKINVMTRRSDKGLKPPVFTWVPLQYGAGAERVMIQMAAEVADAISQLPEDQAAFKNRCACQNGRSRCDFYNLHDPSMAREDVVWQYPVAGPRPEPVNVLELWPAANFEGAVIAPAPAFIPQAEARPIFFDGGGPAGNIAPAPEPARINWARLERVEHAFMGDPIAQVPRPR